jgi:hypothetical protein
MPCSAGRRAGNGFSDLYPEVSLRWNSGVNNWMIQPDC